MKKKGLLLVSLLCLTSCGELNTSWVLNRIEDINKNFNKETIKKVHYKSSFYYEMYNSEGHYYIEMNNFEYILDVDESYLYTHDDVFIETDIPDRIEENSTYTDEFFLYNSEKGYVKANNVDRSGEISKTEEVLSEDAFVELYNETANPLFDVYLVNFTLIKDLLTLVKDLEQLDQKTYSTITKTDNKTFELSYDLGDTSNVGTVSIENNLIKSITTETDTTTDKLEEKLNREIQISYTSVAHKFN